MIWSTQPMLGATVGRKRKKTLDIPVSAGRTETVRAARHLPAKSAKQAAKPAAIAKASKESMPPKPSEPAKHAKPSEPSKASKHSTPSLGLKHQVHSCRNQDFAMVLSSTYSLASVLRRSQIRRENELSTISRENRRWRRRDSRNLELTHLARWDKFGPLTHLARWDKFGPLACTRNPI